MGTALLEARFGDLAQQLVVAAGSWYRVTATSRAAPALRAGMDATVHRPHALERAQRGASDGAVTHGTAGATRAHDDAAVGPRSAPGRSRPTSPRRAALARLAQNYLEANLEQPFSLRQLGQMAHCSERVLQYAFRDIYGMGPQAWFQAMKLKEANRELRTARARNLRVSDVALRCGFTHFGRFSVEYRRTFGESPSETLRRASQNESTTVTAPGW